MATKSKTIYFYLRLPKNSGFENSTKNSILKCFEHIV